MKLKHYSSSKLKQQIKAIVKKYLDLNKYSLFLFGSRVRGDNFERADIDIGIEGPDKIEPQIKFKIKEDLENLPVLYKFDLIDFKAVTPKFKKEALKYIEKI